MDRRRWVGFDTFVAEALGDAEVEPDNVVNLNANVVELQPPDDAA